jgi:molecular chaperone GrpE (heat shock protein)
VENCKRMSGSQPESHAAVPDVESQEAVPTVESPEAVPDVMPAGEVDPVPAVQVETDAADPVDEPPADEKAPAYSVIADRLEAIEARLDETARLGNRNADLVDRLHAENRLLRQGELEQATLPLFRDLMRLVDDLERMIASADASARDLVLIRDTLLAILRRNGADRFEPASGEPFDSSRHQAARVVQSSEIDKDRTIARTLRAGFLRDDLSVIRVAEVEVFRHVPDATSMTVDEADPPENGIDTVDQADSEDNGNT